VAWFLISLPPQYWLQNSYFWFGLVLFYWGLAGLLNRTAITVAPEQLTIRHGPLPLLSGKQFDPILIKQVFVRRHASTERSSYEVYMLTWDGREEKLLGDLNRPEQALYLEQEIERQLGIKDKPVPGELPAELKLLREDDWPGWRATAQKHQLNFTLSQPVAGTLISGRYRGYDLELVAYWEDQHEYRKPRTRLSLAAGERNVAFQRAAPVPRQALEELFNPVRLEFLAGGEYQVEAYGQKLVYRQAGFETRPEHLHFMLETLSDLLAAYAQMVALGGEMIPFLETVLAQKDHPLRPVVTQLLQDIAATTLHLRDRRSQLVCKHCIVHAHAHEVTIPGSKSVIYYGCRVCRQSHEFFQVKQVVAVLDSRMGGEPVEERDILRVNWLSRRRLFDFDEVEIIQVGDEEVERFVIQVGNDLDEIRKPRYREMPCLISPGCVLAENTLRILYRTFRVVRE
jgi:hypothetical protein